MVRFATIGTSKITTWLLEAAAFCKDYHLEAVYSRSKEKGTAFASKYGASNTYNDETEELLKVNYLPNNVVLSSQQTTQTTKSISVKKKTIVFAFRSKNFKLRNPYYGFYI